MLLRTAVKLYIERRSNKEGSRIKTKMVIGALADRTNTRWGKFRPWVLWTSIPWGVILFLAYSTTAPKNFSAI
jgi:Na+/melibiose symporter-like transporter